MATEFGRRRAAKSRKHVTATLKRCAMSVMGRRRTRSAALSGCRGSMTDDSPRRMIVAMRRARSAGLTLTGVVLMAAIIDVALASGRQQAPWVGVLEEH